MFARPQHLVRHAAAALALALCASVADSAAEEIYRWTDAQGNLHFTSDLNQVPEQYRNQSQRTTPNASIIVAEDADAPTMEERLKTLQQRGRELEQQRKTAAIRKKQSTRKARGPGTEPRKYEHNCRHRTSNGRCRRHRTAAWNKWNALREKYEADQ